MVLSFAGYVHGILVAKVASEPLKGQDPLDPLRSRAGWNCRLLRGCIWASLSQAGGGQGTGFSSSPQGAFDVLAPNLGSWKCSGRLSVEVEQDRVNQH